MQLRWHQGIRRFGISVDLLLSIESKGCDMNRYEEVISELQSISKTLDTIRRKISCYDEDVAGEIRKVAESIDSVTSALSYEKVDIGKCMGILRDATMVISAIWNMFR
jgi:hypothetical protein